MKLNRLLGNIEIKLICLLLAVVLWLYAGNPKGTETIDRLIKTVYGSEQGTITFSRIPVRLLDPQKKWQADPGEVLLEARCIDAEVDISSLQLVVNLRRRDEDNRRVILTADNVTLPKGLIFVRAEPKEIQLVPVL